MCVHVCVCVSIVCTVLNTEKCYEVCILHGVYGLRVILTAESVPYGGHGWFLTSCGDGSGCCMLAAGSHILNPQVSDAISVESFNEA